MEMELEPRVKPLPYKVKATSRESNPQKAAHVLDHDLRTHWSTGTNTKEWILLELDEPCLLSHLRIYNKSVLEWEITVGLRYKPEAFVKVRPRCEAPRRDMMYPMNYTPCRYVRISCLRGNPIAIYFIQLIGVSVNGLEPEFQPVVNYLLPHIISHKQEAHDMYFQFLQDMTSRLQFFLPQLETDLANFTDEAEFNIRFFAMLTGPFYPILQIVKERESAKALLSIPDSDAFKGSQTSATLTVSSNFEAQPRRTRSPSPFIQHTTCSIAFRSDAILMLLKKAYRDSHLGTVCCTASRALHRLVEPITSQEESVPSSDLSLSSNSDESTKSEVLSYVQLSDYSSLFGEAFKIPDASWDATYLNILDIAAVEEGIIHVLYACASQPPLCLKLADYNSDFWSILPLVQALLPALRPPINSPVQVDDAFSQWKHSSVQHALSQIVSMSSSTVYRPLLRACAGYLSSFSSSHAKAACVLIDLCCGPFSPWIATVIAKVDLATELMEDLLQVIQGASIVRARAALKYIILALSGHMDDVLANYKENKHKLLFLLEMLEPFLDPAMTAMRSAIAFGDVSTTSLEKQERSCAFALNLVRTAAQRPAVLPSLESEWRSGSVAPSVLLSILGPQIPLPPDIDLCKCSTSKLADQESRNIASGPHLHSHEFSSMFSSPGESDEKIEMLEPTVKVDANDDANLLFAPPELKKTVLISHSNHFMWNNPDRSLETGHGNTEGMEDNTIHRLPLDNSVFVEFFNLQADYMQLVDHQDCALRSSEFQRLAQDLRSQHDITPEGHDAAIDALLLAAECYVNPFFMVSFRPASYLMDRLKPVSKLMDQLNSIKSNTNKNGDVMELGRKSQNKKIGIEKIAHMEAKRDKAVLWILLQAAKLNVECQVHKSQGEMYPNDSDSGEQDIDIHSLDLHSADAVTIVRRNQALLCNFIVQRLQREQHLSHEILLQSLLFLLHSATELFCPPESVIDIIIQSAEDLNGMFTSLYHQIKEGNMHLDMENSRVLQRRWVLLQRLVLASSGSGEVTNSVSNRTNRFQYRCLVPPSSWMQRISKFSNNTYPLPRYLGWMAISRYAKLYLKERLFFASDLSQLTSLLTIFTDALALVDKVAEQKLKASDRQLPVNKQCSDESGGDESLCVLYPDLHKFFPNMKEQFGSFGEIILEAVGLQLKCLPSSAVPDLLCWFSDLCMWPYSGTGNSYHTIEKISNSLKGYSSIHAKVIVLYLLESIVSEHMEAMVPEMPRVAQILISLCSASYCDVAFLESALGLLQPLISYFLRKVTDDAKLFSDELSSLDFELIFEQLFDSIKCRKGYQDVPGGKKARGSLMIFVLGTLFPDFSSRRKIEILQSLLEWVDFTASDPTSSYYDYLCAFHKVMKSCHMLLLQNLNLFDILKPFKKSAVSEQNTGILDSCSYFLKGYTNCSETEEIDGTVAYDLSDQGFHQLSADDVKEFSEDLELLISKLSTAIEISWELHPQLAKKLTCISAKCFLFARCLCSISQEGTIATSGDDGSLTLSKSNELLSKYWQNALEGLTSLIVTIQQNQCWEVGSAMLDYLLRLPQTISLDCVLCSVCSVIKHFFLHAPRISWRLQTDKWLSYLFMRGIANGNEASLLDLFSSMLSHWEPEQRSVALQHLGRIVCLDNNDGVARLSNSSSDNFFASDSTIVVPESIVSALVTSTWDRVAVVALSDPCMLLRSHAMALLSGYIPFADRAKLQSFLVATNSFMRSMGRLSPSMEECHVTRLSLNLLASACLYSPAEDVALIPESVWRNLEDIGMSKTGGLNDGDKKLCQALCKLKAEPHGAKEALQDVLSSSYFTKQSDPNFSSTRESILQVLSSLTSIQSYFDFFSRKTDEVSQELEEAEIEMDLLQKEKALQEVSRSSPEEISVLPSSVSHDKEDNSRLQKIKDGIQFLERSKHREEIVARRQKKLLMRRARQKYLEEVASREMELLQEIDRERTNEMERTIERQKQLELERAKTRELQFNLDMERERQTQRELQRELEQVESGFRSSRREYSSNPTSRPRERERERFRERDNVRSGNEGSLRPSSRGRESATSQTATSPSPTVVLAGSRSFSGQLPTILQSRERIEERGGAAYEDNFEGSRDSGDASSMGDPELASAFDGLPGGFGPVPRPGSRGSKSRPVGDRREKEGRREGKWERKH